MRDGYLRSCTWREQSCMGDALNGGMSGSCGRRVVAHAGLRHGKRVKMDGGKSLAVKSPAVCGCVHSVFVATRKSKATWVCLWMCIKFTAVNMRSYTRTDRSTAGRGERGDSNSTVKP